MTLLAQLRDRTQHHHAAVERQFGLYDRQWSSDSYRATLRRFLGYYEPLESRIQAAVDWPALGFEWSSRQKVALLKRDLDGLGDSPEAVAMLPRCTVLPEVGSLSQALGCMYVLEGATLGGQVVARHLAGAMVPSERTEFAFFLSYGDQVGPMWRAFGQFLMSQPVDDEATLGAACETFVTLERWLRADAP